LRNESQFVSLLSSVSYSLVSRYIKDLVRKEKVKKSSVKFNWDFKESGHVLRLLPLLSIFISFLLLLSTVYPWRKYSFLQRREQGTTLIKRNRKVTGVHLFNDGWT